MRPISECRAKKSVINQTISIFILVLMIVVISGFIYWFISEFKDTIATTTAQSGQAINESVYINSTGYYLIHSTDVGFANPVIIAAYNISNETEHTSIALANISVSSSGLITNATTEFWDLNVTLSYNFDYTGGTTYNAINDTEAASLNIIDLLPFIFMALGFVIIIGVLIRILVPIMNLGNSFGGSGF